MVIYRVSAVDEFGRLFSSDRAFGKNAEEDLPWISEYVFRNLVSQILVLMGTSARGVWTGSVYNIWNEAESEVS